MRKWDPVVTPPDAPAPAFCPSCGSRELTTTSKTADASAYWRCVTCGEVWNVARREAGARRPSRVPGTYW